ncbi:cephalosporin hydroxylase family protein [Iodobacter fluviatilis]|jgi:cephalosporin hydroxylase|uniref:Cephalosporin hydroxylase n=1 Tax=Iodobacter fluviatilis TaxID=537 RepID=A0A7G3GD69_9NEIS|nr:cephalosporin hydroxylase family protein [Iodobacter fluviatilis]QBC45002.1 cephalosporin hydroxylase [Iodobacter fluviatilis]
MTNKLHAEFERERAIDIQQQGRDGAVHSIALDFLIKTAPYKYAYNFKALGRPIIQFPQDMIAIQELIWEIKPDLIIETGIAHGGSLIMNASVLAMLDYCDAVSSGEVLDPLASKRKMIGLDIDIRQHNREEIEKHPLAHKIEMIQGSSIDASIVKQVKEIAAQYSKVLVLLDSNHTHDHVLAELKAYAPLVSKGSYCIVYDTVIEDMPVDSFPDRPWDVGNNPKTALHAYLNELQAETVFASDGERLFYEIDKEIENKLLITVAPDGYLKRA